MKRSFLTLVALFAWMSMVIAQTLTTTDAVLVYYMPKTLLAFDVEYTETTRTQGPLYQYAERYLGTKDIVMADETKFELKDINLRTKTVADKERAYKFTPSSSQRANIVLDKHGLLKAYNMSETTDQFVEEKGKSSKTYETESRGTKRAKDNSLAPLSEEALFASSKAKMAEAAAKQIYRLREARTSLLSGELEHMPADSKMMAMMLEELNKQEAQLVALFVGTTKVHRHHKVIYLTPEEDVKDTVLMRFSRFEGPVAADNLSGEPFVLTMKTEHKELLPSEEKNPKAVSDIYYNLPGEAVVRVCDSKGIVLINQTIPVAQFGVSIALPQELIKRKPHILFNTRTGAIQSISE